jgi:hypothetical protein
MNEWAMASKKAASLREILRLPAMYTPSILPRGLAQGCQPVRCGIPAQCPGRGRLTAVPLGRGPSLHGLSRGSHLSPSRRLLQRVKMSRATDFAGTADLPR